MSETVDPSTAKLNKIARIKEKRKQQSIDRAISASKILSTLPKNIDPITLAAFRSEEIQSIENELVASVANRKRRLFQTLPRHLRRRSASYNCKRVPKQYRARAIAEFTSMGTASTLPPKKSHRSPATLSKGHMQAEYASRQRQDRPKWLETHIWHAKRMQMTSKWGFKIAQRSNQKVFRFNYRTGKEGCCIYDYSYLRSYFFSSWELLIKFTENYCTLDEEIGNINVKGSISGFVYEDLTERSVLLSFVVVLKYNNGWIVVIHPSAIERFSSIAKEFSMNGPLKINIFCLFGNETESVLNDVITSVQPMEKNCALRSFESATCKLYPLSSPFRLTTQYYWMLINKDHGREWWRKCIYKNAKPYSLQDLYNFYFENTAFLFPFHFPSSSTFQFEIQQTENQLLESHLAKPPSKRLNYDALGITSPFQFLFADESDTEIVYFESVSVGLPLFNARIYLNVELAEAVGCVLYGNYSLNSGKGRGLAVIKRGISDLFWCRNINSPKEHSFQCKKL